MTVSPGGPPGDDPLGHVLASDAEREAVVERLRVAVADGRLTMDELSDRSEIAYRARTGAELAALTRDLPSGAAPSPGPVVFASDETDRYVAVFSESRREGHWRVPRALKTMAVFGGVKLDMTAAELGAHEIHVRAVAVFGGIELIVPPGVEVHLTGLAVFGGKSAKVPPPPAGAPVLHVHCTAVFGGVEVKVAGPPWSERLATIRDAIRPPRLPGPPPPPPGA
ncbi:hypothetical protein acdb102_05340 [Acidothermaceae bacterium B102]|nr:hypothetical protein acdb102_05340 [Acidothermaceae bacterium B102]